jgi:hypothetical protein
VSKINWDEHGISEEVREARPYVRWTRDDISPVQDAFPGSSWIVGRARQSDGWVITRHVPPGLHLPPVLAEIRPDDPVKTGPPTVHWHGDDPTLQLEEGAPLQF